MKAEAHVVQDLRFEVEFESQDQAFDEQERLSAFAQGPALRIVEEAFDEALAPGEVLRLELLDIDLGAVDAADMEAQWADRLRVRLQEVLAGHRAQRAPAATEDAHPGASWHTPEQADLEALLHFLQHGRHAWHSSQHSDPVALANRVWQHSAQGLVSRLRGLLTPVAVLPTSRDGLPSGASDEAAQRVAQRVLQRLLRQLPGPWLQAMEAALRGAAAVPQRPWPSTLALAQQRLQLALVSPLATVAAVPTTVPPAADTRQPMADAERRAALHRLKALLMDDASTLSAADQAELQALWQRLQRTDAEGLRQSLLSLGALARVRRRMARLWPEALLRQLPALWLGTEAAAAVAAAVKDVRGHGRPAARRQRWEAALRHLLVAGGLDPFDCRVLAAAIDAQAPPRGSSGPSSMLSAQLSAQPPLWPSLRPSLLPPLPLPAPLPPPLLPDTTADQTRAALRLQANTWARQRVLAAVATRADLARCLSAWLPAADAGALAALAFDTLPRAWLAAQPAGASPLDAARRCQWCLQHLASAPDDSVTAQNLVAVWWRAIALQLQHSPSALLAALQRDPGPADRGDTADSARRAAWLRWLPVGAAQAAVQQPLPAATSVARGAAGSSAASSRERAAEHARADAPEPTPAPAPASASASASASEPGPGPEPAAARLRLIVALSGGAWDSVPQDWQRMQRADPDTLRAVLRECAAHAAARRHIATQLSPSMWFALLTLFLPEPAAMRLAAGLMRLARLQPCAVEPSGVRPDAEPDPATTIELRSQALAALLWRPSETGSDAGSAVLTKLLHRRARDLALPPSRVARAAAVDAGRQPALAQWFEAAARRADEDAAVAEIAADADAEVDADADAEVEAQVDTDTHTDTEVPAARLALALQPGGAADLALGWQAVFAAGPGPALRALQQLAEQTRLRHSLAQQADPRMWRQLLALCLPPGQDAQVEQAAHSLALEMSGTLGLDDATRFLRERSLEALLWQPGPDASRVAGHLLEQTAWRLGLPLPALAQRLESGASAAGLFAPWVAERSPRDIGVLARSADRANGIDRTGRGHGRGHRARHKPTPATASIGPVIGSVIGLVINHLRSPYSSAATEATQGARTALLALCGPGHKADDPVEGRAVRHALAHELESPASAHRLAHWLQPGELRSVVAWLRPTDATALRTLWPALQALADGDEAAESTLSTASVGAAVAVSAAASAADSATDSASAPAPAAWPVVARQLLRECFEEDRPLDPAGLQQRARQALQRAAALRQPVPVESSALSVATSARAPHTLPDPLADIPTEALFINNAGLVLAAPYLPRLFGMLGLAGDKAFVDAAAAERGVLLLQYAVTGELQAPEPLLLLNKILCGLPLHGPVGRDFEPSRAERDAVDGLLRAIIGHWKALGQTSVAGLRQTFLQREGRLEHKDDTWQLQVQRQTFDVLLDRLPWGFATIKYPWMREVLHVQW